MARDLGVWVPQNLGGAYLDMIFRKSSYNLLHGLLDIVVHTVGNEIVPVEKTFSNLKQ